MSPLKINLLLELYACAYPLRDRPVEQQVAPAMRQAFTDFARQGLIWPDLTLDVLLEHRGMPGVQPSWTSDYAWSDDMPYITPKGMRLVRALIEIEPEPGKEPR